MSVCRNTTNCSDPAEYW